MAADSTLSAAIDDLERRLSRQGDGHRAFTLTPGWWQERLLEWATTDADFRTKLLRFVDVLPTLRTTRSVADHVRQYFHGAHPGLIRTASGLAAEPIFRPILSQAVRQGVFAMAHRFIAGATPGEAVPALRRLAEQGVGYTVDLLGEETLSDVEADAYLARYTELLEGLAAADLPPLTSSHQPDPWSGVPAVNISVKLSALCSHLEPAAPAYVSSAVRERLRPLLRLARKHNAFINVDMEQYRHKDLVHTAFADLVVEREFADYPHVGIVVQAYLRDALDDIDRLRDVVSRRTAPFHVRLVKGAYWDEENIVAAQNSWPVPVWTDKRDTDHNFEACAESLLNAWPEIRSAFGTHNPRSVAHALASARALGLKGPDIEFQVLYGMAEDLRNAIAAEGYRTRVYLPVGQVIPGMAYLVRRLLENTSNQAWFNVATTTQGIEAGTSTREIISPAAQGSGPEAPGAFRNAAPAPFFLPDTRVLMERALNAARARFGSPYPLLIGDRRIDDREQAGVTGPPDPSTVIGRVAQGTTEDVEAAIAAAREAFPAWRDMAPTDRTQILFRAAELMEKRRYDLAAVMVFECAKPWHEADGDVIEAIDYLRYYALQGQEAATPRPLHDVGIGVGVNHPRVPGEHDEYFHEGRGITAVIAPWNFPLAIICGMSVASLAAGNCAILKPAAQSPIIAFHLVELLREAGVPAGAVQYLPGPGSRVGQALVEHPGIANIAFTGSKEVGLGITQSAGRQRAPSGAATPAFGSGPRPAPKRVVAEMGGKNAIIIDDDADLDQAVSGAVISAFGYAGQKCSACSRLIVVGHAYDEAVSRLKNAVESLVVGPADDPATFVPPVIGASARDKIMEYVALGRVEATLLAQAQTLASAGSYVPPTVFTDVPRESRLAREEIFGPVLSVFRAATFEEALEIALDSEFALTGGVFSRNPRHIEAAKREFRVGNLYINRKVTGAVVGRHPFGGLAMSGIGEKAGGPDYVRQFMDARSVTENTTRRGFAPE